MEKWTVEVEADLQALARLAALSVPAVPILTSVKDVEVAAPEIGGLPQRVALRELTLDAYERWAATYPGAADALERSLDTVTAASEAQAVAAQIRTAQVNGAVDDWVDDETFRVLYGPEPETPWCPPVVQVEQVMAWSALTLKARLVGWFRTWPANAPLLPS